MREKLVQTVDFEITKDYEGDLLDKPLRVRVKVTPRGMSVGFADLPHNQEVYFDTDAVMSDRVLIEVGPSGKPEVITYADHRKEDGTVAVLTKTGDQEEAIWCPTCLDHFWAIAGTIHERCGQRLRKPAGVSMSASIAVR